MHSNQSSVRRLARLHATHFINPLSAGQKQQCFHSPAEGRCNGKYGNKERVYKISEYISK